MGLIVYIYRDNLGDCTNGGISSKVDRLCLVNVEGPFEPRPDLPAAVLQRGPFPGTLNIVPATEEGEPLPGWFMFGGNYAATSDSRFGEACEKIAGIRFPGAVAIHDRQE